MDLIVNSMAAARSSMGVRRAFNGVMQHLHWNSKIIFPKLPQSALTARVVELSQLGRRNAIYWTPTHRGPLRAHHHVVTVHDCINVEYVYRDDWRLPFFRRVFNSVLANAQVVVAVSRATKDALLRNYTLDESKLVVIPLGFELHSESVPSLPTPSVGPPFILMLTNALPHKNALLACRAFMQSRLPREGFIFRVVGSPPAAVKTFCKNAQKIEVHAGISDALLRSWYKSAAFLVSPSLAEGFNLPAAEAIVSGGNVLCSDIPAHREFFAGRASFFDPYGEDSIIAALNMALLSTGTCWYPASNHNLRTWKDVAEDYRALFQSIEREQGR